MARRKMMPEERELEHRLFYNLLSSQEKSFKQFFHEYNDRISRPSESFEESEANSYEGFFAWFYNRGLKLRRLMFALKVLGYRIVIVPEDSTVTVTKGDITASSDTGTGEQLQVYQYVGREAKNSVTAGITVNTITALTKPKKVKNDMDTSD